MAAENHVKHVMQKLEHVRRKKPEDEMNYTELAAKFQKKINSMKERDRLLSQQKRRQREKCKLEQYRARQNYKSKNQEMNQK